MADGRDPRGSHTPPDCLRLEKTFLGWVVFTIIQIPVREFTAMTKALRQGTRPLRVTIGVFPEPGERVQTEV